MKVVINNCYGGFGLSPEATLELWKRGGPVESTPVSEYYGTHADGAKRALQEWREYLENPILRRRRAFITVFSPDEKLVLYAGHCNDGDKAMANPTLVSLVEEMGEAANGASASLKVVDVPDDAEWEIDEYDGNEHVAERHRSWS